VAIIKVKDNNPVAAIQELLGSMLSEGLVSAILVPQEIPSKKTVVQTLVRDPANLDGVNPLAPVFSVNSARIIAKMCIGQMAGTASEPVVAQEPEQEQEKQADQPAAENQASEQKEEQTPEQKQSKSEEQVSVEAQSATENQPAATEGQSMPAPIAVVLRPCEIRALVELW
jgi:hypothetical protein